MKIDLTQKDVYYLFEAMGCLSRKYEEFNSDLYDKLLEVLKRLNNETQST